MIIEYTSFSLLIVGVFFAIGKYDYNKSKKWLHSFLNTSVEIIGNIYKNF